LKRIPDRKGFFEGKSGQLEKKSGQLEGKSGYPTVASIAKMILYQVHDH
jgi:hypothetical protein